MRKNLTCNVKTLPVFCILLLGLCFGACSGDAPGEAPRTMTPVQLGSFAFSVSDEWNVAQSPDSLQIEHDSCRIKVTRGYNLTFSLFGLVIPQKLPALSAKEISLLSRYFPSPYYPDSLPAQLGKLRFGVVTDTSTKCYVCYSDTAGFASELLIVHIASGTCIHFETLAGHTQADSLFRRLIKEVRFSPAEPEPALLAFSFTDTAINCCDELLRDGASNPFYRKTVTRYNDSVIEYWTAARFDNTVVGTLNNSMHVKGDSVLLSAVPGLYDMEFVNHEFIASPPRMIMIQCDCWTCRTVHYTLRVPGSPEKYKLKFTGKTTVTGDTVLQQRLH